MSKLKLSRVLLASAILLIVAFQLYWLNRLYREEKYGLKKDINGIFRDVVYRMQVDRFKSDTLIYKPSSENLFAYNAVNAIRHQTEDLKKKAARYDSATRLAGESKSFFNRTNTDYPKGHFEIQSASLPPELLRMLAKQTSSVSLPPSMDTAVLRRMSQSGVNLMVSYNNNKDSPPSVTFDKAVPSAIILRGRPLQKPIANPLGVARKYTTTIRLDRSAGNMLPEKPIVRLIMNGKALDDTLPIRKIDSIYKKELAKAGIPISFSIKKGKDDSLHRKDTINSAPLTTSPAIVGFINPYWYQAAFENPTGFLLKKISLQILFSLFLVAFTSVAFIFLYRNLVAQRKLTEIKNDFISNITHELKTPLATVSVAVEALRNFGGIQDPRRTKEYLDISAAELQRLSLLVDKVLKLSLFENRELELKKERFDLKQLTEEVLNTMQLQFDAHHARIELAIQGNYFLIDADRMHITSVIFNLLDNALKYSSEKPGIIIRLQHLTETIVLQVEDNGIGIPPDFKTKIFDKFFRVPTGNHHNIKGYGLGLSYVAHVIKTHNGTISVESEPGKGSLFTIKFPVT